MNTLNPSTDQNPMPAAAANGSSSVNETVEKVRKAAASTAAKAKDKVAEIAGEGKNAAADKVAGYSERLRETARSADAAKDPNIAHFAGQAADRLGEVANYVREADFNRLQEDASRFARRNPALFMGGMLVAGLVLGNLAKASFQTLREANPNGEADDNQNESGGRDEAQSRDQDGPDTSVGAGDGGLAAAVNTEKDNAQL